MAGVSALIAQAFLHETYMHAHKTKLRGVGLGKVVSEGGTHSGLPLKVDSRKPPPAVAGQEPARSLAAAG